MNGKRGRPCGKVYPPPANIFEGIWNAQHGKIGISEPMPIAMFCPYRMIEHDKRTPREKELLKRLERAPWDEKLVKQLRRYFRNWDCATGSVIGQKIAAYDHQFFRQLGDSVKELAGEEPEARSPARLFALEYKLLCFSRREPFSLKAAQKLLQPARV